MKQAEELTYSIQMKNASSRKNLRRLSLPFVFLVLYGLSSFVGEVQIIQSLSPHVEKVSYSSETISSTAAICCIALDEEAYLDQWVDYHLALGFSHIYVYDNSPDYELESFAARRKHGVTVLQYPRKGAQKEAYLDCAKLAYLDGHTWAAFFDIDEYLKLYQHDNVVDFLSHHLSNPESGGLAINWALMYDPKQLTYEPRPVVQRFLGWYGVDTRIKSIVRLKDYDFTRLSCTHHPFLMKGTYLVDTEGKKMVEIDRAAVDCKFWRNFDPPADPSALLIHYECKSWKEYIEKRLRGRTNEHGKDLQGEQVVLGLARKGHFGMRKFGNTGHFTADTNDTMEESYPYSDEMYKTFLSYAPKYAMFDEDLSIPATAHDNYNKSSVAVCVFAMDDEAYLDEFVDYHHAIGFSHLYIYDSSIRNWLSSWGSRKGSHVILKHFPVQAKERTESKAKAYLDCAQNHGEQHDFLAFFDVDSFLILRRHRSIVELLQESSSESCPFFVSEYRFGTGGHKVYEPLPVTKRFMYRDSESHLSRPILSRHQCHASNATVFLETLATGTFQHETSCHGTKDAVFHQYIRSYKECKKWLQSHRTDGTVLPPSGSDVWGIDDVDFEELEEAAKDRCTNSSSVYDDSAWTSLKRQLPKYAGYDTLFADET